MKRISIFLIIFGLSVILAFKGSIYAADDPMSAAGVYTFSEKLNAPGFRVEDVDGNQVKLKDYRDKIVLLFFWTTW